MKARILIIEDNPDNLELVRFLLTRAGHEVSTATDGTSGLNLARKQHPDMVILDMGLPEMDGWTVAAHLKGAPTTQDIRLVALTAYTSTGDRRRALQAGCDGYLSKPIQAETFADEIHQFLENQEST